MKHRLLQFAAVLLVATGCISSASAQMPHWTVMSIPGDSLSPFSLTFFDSLHGYLGASKTTLSPVDNNFRISQQFFFETSDGGRSWQSVTDTLVIGRVDPYHGGSYPGGLPMVFGSLQNRYIFDPDFPGRQYGGMVRSTDGGLSWSPVYVLTSAGRPQLGLLHAFSSTNLLVCDFVTGIIYDSYDGGLTFPMTTVDTAYRFALAPFSTDSSSIFFGKKDTTKSYGHSISFDNSDMYHWAVAVDRGSFFANAAKSGFPMGLQTMNTSNFGATWTPHLTAVPGEDSLNRISGILQYVKGTSDLYYFTNFQTEGFRQVGGGQGGTIADYGAPLFGINWMYSTDDGASWDFQRNYGATRRGFEAVRDSEVWITARPSYSTLSTDAAYIIARTTDNGTTWQEDSTSLRIESEKLDGRIVTFSDPGHGWIAATSGVPNSPSGYHIVMLRYDASEQQTASVELSENEIVQKYFLKIFPNPSTEQVHLQLANDKLVQLAEFFDIMGRSVNIPLRLDNNIATADVHNLSPGCYITRVTYLYKGYVGTFTLPLMVQH